MTCCCRHHWPSLPRPAAQFQSQHACQVARPVHLSAKHHPGAPGVHRHQLTHAQVDWFAVYDKDADIFAYGFNATNSEPFAFYMKGCRSHHNLSPWLTKLNSNALDRSLLMHCQACRTLPTGCGSVSTSLIPSNPSLKYGHCPSPASPPPRARDGSKSSHLHVIASHATQK